MSMSNSEARKRAAEKKSEQGPDACDGTTCDCDCGSPHTAMVTIAMPVSAAAELAEILRKFDQLVDNDQVLHFHYERPFWNFLAEQMLVQLVNQAEAGEIPQATDVRPLEVVKP